MEADVNYAIPAPAPDDAEGVCWALSTATSLWQIDQRDEAMKWLRRAAEAAREAGSAARALDLLRTAARLVDEEPTTTKTPGDGPVHPPVSSSRPVSSPRPLKTKPPPLPAKRPLVRAVPPPRPRAPETAATSGHMALRVAVRMTAGTSTIEPLSHDKTPPAGTFVALLVPVDAADADALLAWQRSLSRPA